MNSMQKQICGYDELPDPGSKGLSVDICGERTRIFIVKKNKKIYAYVNSCPHTGGPLDWTPDCFLDEEGNHIVCANHGALFRIRDGLCLYGPCRNQCLRALASSVRDRMIHILI